MEMATHVRWLGVMSNNFLTTSYSSISYDVELGGEGVELDREIVDWFLVLEVDLWELVPQLLSVCLPNTIDINTHDLEGLPC
jgi:hypothetical protein